MLITAIVSPSIPSWQKDIILSLASNTDIQLSCIALPKECCHNEYQQSPPSLRGKKLLTLLNANKRKHDAFASMDLNTIDNKGWNRIEGESTKPLTTQLILNLHVDVNEKKLSDLIKVPVVGIRFGKSPEVCNPLATYRDVLSLELVTILHIYLFNPGFSNPVSLYDAAGATIRNSIRANSNRIARKAVEVVPRVLLRLKGSQEKVGLLSYKFLSDSRKDNLAISKDCRFSFSNCLPMAPRWLTHKLINSLKSKLFRKQWILAAGKSDSPLEKPQEFNFLVPPKNCFWADPHLIEHNGEVFVFFEELLYKTNKGHISCAPLYQDGTMGERITVIEKKYHLSYPFLIESDNEIYMIPESAENKTIELYLCKKFPDQWEFLFNLMEDVEAYDATVFQHGGYWWLFTNISILPGVSSWDQLFLFYAETFPTNKWIPHPGNPVVDDVRSSRPAGKMFIKDSKLYRPSQDSSGKYGRGLNINQVTELSPERYSETLITKWLPGEFKRRTIGTHSYSHLEETVLIDLQINSFTFPKTGE